MKNQSIRNRILWGAGTILALSVCYILSRHDVLGQWHYMIDWPFYLFVFGLATVFIASFSYSRIVMICTVAGYMIGFILAILFSSNYSGSGDTLDAMSYNNAWIIWTGGYLVIIGIGIIWDIINRRVKGKKRI